MTAFARRRAHKPGAGRGVAESGLIPYNYGIRRADRPVSQLERIWKR